MELHPKIKLVKDVYPPINEMVVIINKKMDIVTFAKWRVYDSEIFDFAVNEQLSNGDLFWEGYSPNNDVIGWGSAEAFPFWCHAKDLKHIFCTSSENNENETDRFDILDLGK